MGHIFNKDLYDDPRDLEIAKLRFTISKFKEYDKKRKARKNGKKQKTVKG